MPWKEFADAEVLDASEVNTYFMNQAVLRFTDAAARAEALGAFVPIPGMFSYLTSTSTIEIYDGSSWTPQIATITNGAVTEAKIATGAVTETKIGTGAVTSTKLGSSLSLTTPNIGVATATSVNKVAITAPATSSTLTIANGKTLTASNSITLAGTDSATISVSGNATIGSSTHTVAFNTTGNTSVTLPTTGTLATIGGTETLTNKTLTNPILTNPTITGATITSTTGTSIELYPSVANDGVIIQGRSGGTGSHRVTMQPTTLSTNRTLTLPDDSGTVAIVNGNIGIASATSINKVAITAPATSATLTIANGKTLTASNSITLAGTDSSIISVSGNTTIGSSTHTVAFTTTGNTGVTLPTTGTLATLAGTETFTNKTLTSPTVSGLYLSDSSIVFEGSSADANETTITVANPTVDRTITFPDRTGTVITSGDSSTVTETMIDYSTVPKQTVGTGSPPAGKQHDIFIKVA